MRVATEEFFSVIFTKLYFDNKHACCNRSVLFSVTHSWCCLTALDHDYLVLVLIL